ncbi:MULTISPECIES: patatin-like phospholipase family protein [unclassified Bradyrhizobium]|uniref:patatin-like phospholipase family protein n=1 Tax=unclassified Bradyrhizobium TaxID=2631580 RepID=UPI0028EE3AD2|nr:MULTISPECIES: patatin-like phospholipase family protein [unclassified Bradyrhizobium]
MWFRKPNSSGSSATPDHRPEQEPVPQQAVPVRSSASALLSAAQIWSTGDATSPAAQVTEPAAATNVPPSSQPSQPETVVAEMILATGAKPALAAEPKSAATDAKPAATPEKSLAETIATPALSPAPRIWPPRKLSLALQGGGSLSAFAWGVLERLLEEPACDFDTISGASAGAINAALLASGLAEGGRERARELLAGFWNGMASEASFRSVMLLGGFSPAGSSVAFGQHLRAGRFNPLDIEPLHDLLAGIINFGALQSAAAPRLIIAATRVRDGGQQLFRNTEITPDVLLASTCPPQLHCAIDIDGDAYWDGGYGANPPVVSVAHESSAADLLVVQVTPARDAYVPVTSAAIDRRLDQITANAVLNAELAALEWARHDGLHPPRIHRLAAEDEIDGLAQHSATDLGHSFIAMLHQRGRDACERWLQRAPAGTTLVAQEMRPAFPSEEAIEDVLA